jgi:anti-sigma regulatory factor (Ser/Thr protein kinase)
VGLVVTELATNLVKHTAGAGGLLVFSPMTVEGAGCIDILALDQGPGIAHLGAVLHDSYAAKSAVADPLGQSLGLGLGSVRRLSSVFDIYSAPGHGTAVFSRRWQNAPPATAPALAVGAVCLPVHGEQSCGDAWAMHTSGDTCVFLLVDGLGHGPDAAVAANLAVNLFERSLLLSPLEGVRVLHAGLVNTRGAAVAVAELNLASGSLRYAGLGNISGLILGEGTSQNMVSHNGTAGLVAGTIQQLSYSWPKTHGVLVMHSDGVATHWSLQDYPGLAHKHPALIAGVLYRDHRRAHDDSTVIVAKAAEPNPAVL